MGAVMKFARWRPNAGFSGVSERKPLWRKGLRAAPTFACVLLLVSCASKPPPAQDTPAPRRPDPIICAPLEDPPALEGGIVQPTTEAGREATRVFLGATGELFSWGGRGWMRAGKAKEQFCR